MATKTELKTASVLAFERKLDPSDATFFAGVWADQSNAGKWQAIKVREKSVRGTISNRMKSKDSNDAAKLDAKIENPNLQTVDVATLPADCDTLKVAFTLRVLAGTGLPSACNSADYQSKLAETIKAYVDANGFTELGSRYAFNLANGRFLWRNRIGAESVVVHVSHVQDGVAANTWSFNALAFNPRTFQAPDESKGDITSLGATIANGLAGTKHVLLQVTAFVRAGNGQEVFPSQELILDKGSDGKSKTLYTVDGVAGIHSQKLGNAIRTVDNWYPNANELGPIAAEVYGAVTTLGKAFRQPKDKVDFYSLLDEWVLKGKAPSLDNQHFVMSILIRGGVFGDSEKE